VLGSMSQSVKPLLHAETTHAPDLQSMSAFTPAHTMPQAPQLRTSALVAFSQPFFGSWSQSPKPALHLDTTHMPETQPAMPFCAAGQATPHMEQFLASVCVSVSQPSTGSPLQSPN